MAAVKVAAKATARAPHILEDISRVNLPHTSAQLIPNTTTPE